MNLKMRLDLVLFTTLLLLAMIADGADPGSPSASADLVQPKRIVFGEHKVRVLIINNLSGGLDLTVHCKSKNDDLGFHLLPPQGQYQFTFRPKFLWRTTLFFCSFQWNGGFHYFDIYDQKRDMDVCRNCMWSIVQDGPCRFSDSRKVFDLCEKWNPPKIWNSCIKLN